MKLIINGETKIFGEDITLTSVMIELALIGKVMAAAVNMNIVKQNKWDECRLNDGDKIELLDFVGGG
ncbi:MAG: sulfur carrier protein ThiS [Sulfurimonas sp.]|nr:sulfur carrier protein ThiS [Sulfurimonas sp.]